MKNRKISFFILFILTILLLSSCNGEQANQNIISIGQQSESIDEPITYQNIDPETAYKNLEENENIILLDVRTEAEYRQQHIPGSILIPLTELEERVEEVIIDKSSIIYIYCRSGVRSVSAAKIMIELGYTNVYNLGGIIDWPYETKSS
ncbi:MAG: rhodanese-like domain-containing protein [Halanaerobiales bacterium]